MNKVYALFEDFGPQHGEGFELLAVCDSLDRAMSISGSQSAWGYELTSGYYFWDQADPFCESCNALELEHRRRFVIFSYPMNDLDGVLL